MSQTVSEMGTSVAASLSNMIGIGSETDSWKPREKSCFLHHWTLILKHLRRRLPILNWIGQYRLEDLFKDGVAGVILGFTLIPQSIVFASVANVPLQYGLYSSLVGHFLYCLFGTVREMSIGPSAIMALLISDYSSRGGPAYTILLSFLSGCVELCFAFLNLGFLIDFISAPVSCGFSSAAAVMITATQSRTILGLNITANSFFDGLRQTYYHIDLINYWDILCGAMCIIVLLLLRWVNSLEWMDPGPYPTTMQKFTRRIIRLICTSRNAIVAVASAVVAYYLSENDNINLSLVAGVDGGLPSVRPPPFSVVIGNETRNFVDMCKELGYGIFLVPILSMLQHIVVAKIFFRGKSVDDAQELLALGLANFIGSFLSALPISGNLPRSALNSNNNVRSPFVGIFAGGVVLIALQFLTSFFNFIPQSALASMVICAVIFMLDWEIVQQLWTASKIDLFILISTFICCISLGAEYGVLVGIALSLAVLLYNTARPNIYVKISYDPAFILIQPDRMLSFPAVEYVRYKVTKIADERKRLPIIVDGSHLCGMDFTVAQCVKELVEEFDNRNQMIIFTNLQKAVIQVIKGLLIINVNYFATIVDAENSLRIGKLNEKKKTCGHERNENGCIATICNTVERPRSVLKQLGSDCSHPYEHTAWLNVVISIPRLKCQGQKITA